MIKKILSGLLLLSSLAFGQYQGYDGFTKYKSFNYYGGNPLIPTDNLALFVYPSYDFGLVGDNVAPDALTLGPNLVSNWDFHDFTMEDDANTIAHYIFTDYSTEDGNTYIGTERGGTETDLADMTSLTDADEDGWGSVGSDVYVDLTTADCTPSIVTGNSFPTNAQRVVENNAGNFPAIDLRTIYTFTSGKTYRMTGWSRSHHGDFRVRYHSGATAVVVTTSQTVATYFDVVFIHSGAHNEMYLATGSTAAGAWMEVGDFTITELPTNSLVPAGFSANFTTELTGTDHPAYENGKSLKFDGVDDAFSAPNTDFNIPSFTIEAWVKTETLGTNKVIVMNGAGGGAAGWGIRWTSGNAVTAEINGTTGGRQTFALTGGGGTLDSTWHHIAFTADEATGVVAGYIDGAQTNTATLTRWTAIASIYDLRVGVYATGSTWEMDGWIGEVRISNTARTAAEIQASYGLGRGWEGDAILANGDVENYNGTWKQYHSRTGGSGVVVHQDITVEADALYKVTATFSELTGTDDAYVLFQNSALTVTYANAYTENGVNGTFIAYGKAAATGGAVRFSLSVGGEVVMDNIKLQKVTNVAISDTIVTDLSINSYDGSMEGSMADGQITHPHAFEFDGVDDIVDFGDVNDLRTNNFMMFVWIYGDLDPAAYQDIFQKYQDASNSYEFRIFADEIYLYVEQNNIVQSYATSSLNPLDNVSGWRFIAIFSERGVTLECRVNETDYTMNGAIDNTDINNSGDLKMGSWGNANYRYGITGMYISPTLSLDQMKSLATRIYNNTSYLYGDK
jgi:hypothetical protein